MKIITFPTRYGKVAVGLHWVIALLILTLLIMGLVMDSLPLMAKFKAIQWHKSLGLTVLMLVALRICWRYTHPAPMLPAHTPHWQAAVAHGTHGLMYALMVLMPVTGWLFSDAAGYHPNFFGWAIVPTLVETNANWSHLVKEFHEIGGNLLWVLLALHLGAALQHHLLVRDDILQRMLPSFIKVPRPNLTPLLSKILPAAVLRFLSK